MLDPEKSLIEQGRNVISGLPQRVKLAFTLLGLVLVWFVLSKILYFGPVKYGPESKRLGIVREYWEGWDKIENVFAFGDSWTFSLFDPIGDQPTRENPFGNPVLPTPGPPPTVTPLWIHYLTMTYNSTFIRTFNIAKGGAVVDRNVVPPHELLNYTTTFTEQADLIFGLLYAPQRNTKTGWKSTNTLFAVWFGLVDLEMLMQRRNVPEGIVEAILKSYYSALEQLIYHFDARNILLLSLPPMHLAPAAENSEILRDLVLDYNARLVKMRDQLQIWHKDTTIFIFNTYEYLMRVIEDPKHFQPTSKIKNTTINCWDYNPDGFPDPLPWDLYDPKCFIRRDEYFWANPLHPTHPVQEGIAAAAVEHCLKPRRGEFCL